MPTTNPRTQVTLSPSLDQLLCRLAVFQRASKSQVLRELLEAAEPALQRAVALMEAAANASGSVHEGLAQSLSKAQDSLEARMAKEIRRLDSMTSDLVTQAQAIRVRRPSRSMRSVPATGVSGGSGAAVPKNPPASNRGVKSTNRGKGRATTGGRKP